MKNKIKKFLDYWKSENIKNDYYRPRLYGEARSVEYECNGLIDTFCKVTQWSNGEGYDISFDTGKEQPKVISLHTDEIDVFLECLNHFNYFSL